MLADRFRTSSLEDAGVIRILQAALKAVEPTLLVQDFLSTAILPEHENCYLLGVGKAAEGMALGAAEALGDFKDALIITKRCTVAPRARFTVLESGHPVPDERSVTAGQAALDFASRLGPRDLLICLISGGGSALASVPVAGVSLEDIQALTAAALDSGADIEEINNLRRCLDRIKGGGLAAATSARVVGMVLSDVMGDRLEAIASGPTVPLQPDPARAIDLMERLQYSPSPRLLQAVTASGNLHRHEEGGRITNFIVGSARTAAEGARRQAAREGFSASVLEPGFQGEASYVGAALGLQLADEARREPRPRCLIAFGESTVTLSAPHGAGGRNQELALASAEPMDGLDDCMLVALATDGEDGPTDAAGAVVTGRTAKRGRAVGMMPRDYLARHDSHRYFGQLGDLLRLGYTGTNVNDLVLLVAL